jgi:tetratricopeptide (TPR) repeat protein
MATSPYSTIQGLIRMAQEQAKQLLQQGIAASRAGRPDAARDLLQQSIRLDPRNETAWLWLSSVARDEKERLFCLKQLLALNPQNEYALKGLRALGAAAEETAAPEPAPAFSVPVLDEEQYTRLQPTLDDFLRRYNPRPADQLNVRWTHKARRRYGEGGAQRIRQVTYAVAALITIVVIGAAALLISSVTGGNGEATQIAARTRIHTATPTSTMTPTPGGATPTPFPNPMDVPPTAEPIGLQQGSIYGNDATAVYPAPHPNIANAIRGAIGLNSVGLYPDAIGTFEAERILSSTQCYPAVVYYEAMSYAAQDDAQSRNRAAQLLEDALAFQPQDVRLSTCQDSPLILAALGHVRLLQGNLPEAQRLSEQALSEDSALVLATLTKGRVELLNGDPVTARRTVQQGLGESPEDVNLFLLAAEIEVADNQPAAALEYVGKALYVEPVAQRGLQLQAQIYLSLADESEPGPMKLQYYGLGVISAQTLLLYYSGDPVGYLYLAKARIGEGNLDMAESALTRIIEAESRLPENDTTTAIMEEAYRTRGNLYYVQRRFEEARADFTEVSRRDVSDLDTVNKLFTIAFSSGNYTEASMRLEELLDADPENASYLLQQTKFTVELCTFVDDLSCAYSDALRTLGDADGTLFASLDEQQQADAYSYRAQAQYRETIRRASSLTDEERQAAYVQALDDVNRALAVRDTPVDHYYRGLILEEMQMLSPAVEEYQWIAYWNDWYPYPFKDDSFDSRTDRLLGTIREATSAAEATREAIEATMATPTRVIPTATLTRPPTATPTATPTLTPTVTITPSPTITPTLGATRPSLP